MQVSNRRGKNLVAYINDRSEKFAHDFANGAADKMRELAPLRTGKLKKSIKVYKINGKTYRIRVGAFYGIYVNYGTRHMAAQPFYEPGIEWAKANVKMGQ